MVSAEQWRAARAGFQATGERFAELVSSVRQPRTMATADWSVSETAAHLATLVRWSASLVPASPSGGPPPPGPEIARAGTETTVDTVAGLNRMLLDGFPERDLHRVADRLRADVDFLLRATGDLDPATPVSWLGESRLPLAGIFAHLLNEFHIHGRDIARAVRAPWTIRPEEAAMFLELFLVGVTRYGYGRLLDNSPPLPDRRIVLEFRSRYTDPVTMVMDGGRVTVGEPERRPDVRVFFHPVTLNLMLFYRVSKLRAALTGRIVVRGRRPWLLATFLRHVRMPP